MNQPASPGTKRKRVLFAGLFHETHTFVSGTTSLARFAILKGDELHRSAGDSSPLGGALESAREYGWEILPSVDFRASPSAMVEDEVIESFWDAFEIQARPALEEGLDGMFLVLHGAMVSESFTDVEGEILERIRKLPRASDVPIFGVFDLHANFTQRMATHANCLVAYRENPHTDAREAAKIAAALLQRSFVSGQQPKLFWQHPPLMWPPTGTATAADPMRPLENLARRIEADCPEIWAASVIAGFSFADTPDTGVSFVVATVGSEESALVKLKQLSDLAWQKRKDGNATERLIDEVIEQEVLPLKPGLTVLVEPSDNIGGGAPGDGTGILRALVKYQIPNSAVCINDPDAVGQLQQLRVGEEVSLGIGGKGSFLDAGPVVLEVEFVSRSDGKFELEDKQSHLASMSGNLYDMGPTAVVKYNGIIILLTSNKTPPFDLGQWRSQGIEPANLSVIGVKAAVAHRRAYDPIAARMFWVETPGPCSSNLKAFPFSQVRRPIYPLDEVC